MASTTPQVLGPDGVLRDTLRFSTTLSSRFFTGTTDTTAVDVEVSLRGGAYTRDPDYVVFDGTSWVIPNPEVFPDGLDLDSGENTILIRAVTAAGSVSSPASVVVRLVQPGDVSFVALPLTNVSVDQTDDAVKVTVDEPADTTNFRGVNFYASLYEGGGTTGYTRVNINLVDAGTTEEEESEIGSLEVDATVATDSEGDPAADPLYVRVVGTQADKDEVLLQEDFDQKFEVPETTTQLRTTITVSSIRQVGRYSFEHSRTATRTSETPTVFVGTFASAPKSDPLYYVVAAVYYDPTNMVEVESSFSQEVVGRPLTVATTVGTFPVVSRQQIVRNVIEAIFRSNPQLRVEPGSVLRDTFIDPFAAEAEKLRFIVDFLHRAQSFSGLLGVDDPTNSGSSVSVSSSTYKLALKKAFGLTVDSDVQAVIDRAFESLAANYGVFRRSGRFARGQVTFFTTKRPTATIPIPIGTVVSGGSKQFRVTTSASLQLDELARAYDPTTGRYRVTVSVQATSVGSSGNIAAGQVRKVVSGVSGLSVVNAGAMFGGDDQETNHDLATRAQNALASVDSGTARGYLQVAADVPGVVQAQVVSAGDDLMMRDLDSAGVHRGGKVDVWVQGENLATVTDTFAFSRDVAKDVHFVVLGDVADLTFRAIDSALEVGLPIVEMLDDESLELGLRNATTGEWFDLTDVEITSFDTIRLSTDVVQPAVTLTDVVLGDYRRTTGNTFILTRQPVQELESITGTVSGELPADAFRLVHPDDPLLLGRSGRASSYVEITPVADGEGGTTPSNATVVITAESHVLTGEYPESLDNLGADTLTIVITSADGVTTYKGPNDPSGDPDYLITEGDETTAATVTRTTTGDIASGDTVLISYRCAENFTVKYTTNVIVPVVQEAIDARRHATADVLAKEASEVPIDISGTVILTVGADQTTVDTAIRTNLSNFFSGFRLGDPVRQSDVVGIIEGTTGVSYVELPLTKMVRQEGATVIREVLQTGQTGDSTYISAWSTATVSVWLVEDELSSATTDGGGEEENFRGVFQDDEVLELVGSSPGTVLPLGVGRAYIVGSEGISIVGLSDSDTLTAGGYTTADEQASQRKALTANRVLVSTSVDDAPANHDYSVTYIVGVDSGAKNIPAGKAEYLTVGDVEFTFDEDA